jgi:7-carboxy-7-deazaguanine synthase
VSLPPSEDAIPRDQRLRVIELYTSVQGESTFVGLPCLFIRLAGCNLRCTWCDSTFTFTGGVHRGVEAVLAEALATEIPLVELTGGEPLVHKAAIPLMQGLLDAGRTVLLETSGSRDISAVPAGVHIILDLKPPDSGEEAANRWENLPLLQKKDEVKFVIASRRDYDWSRDVVLAHRLHEKVGAVLFSAVFGAVDPADLVAWMLADRVPARFQLQLHKVVWPPDARGV